MDDIEELKIQQRRHGDTINDLVEWQREAQITLLSINSALSSQGDLLKRHFEDEAEAKADMRHVVESLGTIQVAIASLPGTMSTITVEKTEPLREEIKDIHQQFDQYRVSAERAHADIAKDADVNCRAWVWKQLTALWAGALVSLSLAGYIYTEHVSTNHLMLEDIHRNAEVLKDIQIAHEKLLGRIK